MVQRPITIAGSTLRIHELEIVRKEVADYLTSLPEDQHSAALIQAIEVGVFCLERARLSQDFDFVRRQIEGLLNTVENTVSKIPDRTQKSLIQKIGTKDGQVLAPIHALVEHVSKTTHQRVSEIRDLLSQDIDPTKENSALGRALKQLRHLLDPARKDSVQGVVAAALEDITGKRGALTKAVKAVVSDSVKPLADQVQKLALEVRGKEAAQEIIEVTTLKGLRFEEELLPDLRKWAEVVGAEVHHVGGDNRSGDIVVKLSPNSIGQKELTIVIEAKDKRTATGRKGVTEAVLNAMMMRKASAAIYVTRTPDGLSNELGEWGEGACERGPFIACTCTHLVSALRFLIVQHKFVALATSSPDLDRETIVTQIVRIRTSLERVKSINRRVSQVRESAGGIGNDADALRAEIRDALSTLEDAIRSAREPGKKVMAKAAS